MGLKIGLISNVNSRGQVPANLKQYRIDEYFDPIIMSSEYGRATRPCHFSLRVVRLMNVPASQCAYIGDRILSGILLARKVGFRLAIQITTMSMANWNVNTGCRCGEFDDRNSGSLAGGNEPFLPAANQPVQALIFDAGDIPITVLKRGSR